MVEQIKPLQLDEDTIEHSHFTSMIDKIDWAIQSQYTFSLKQGHSLK